ncbi:MAG: hypothetical protein AAGA30_09135 [Planctomycetota bacterium]
MSRDPNSAETESNPYSAPSPGQLTPAKVDPKLQAYSIARIGIMLVYYSVVSFTFLLLAFAFLALVASDFGGTSTSGIVSPTFGKGLVYLFLLGLLAGALGFVLGVAMCYACPRSNEKTMAIVAILAVCIFVVTTLGSRLVQSGSPRGISVVASIAFFTGAFSLIMLHRLIGANIQSSRLRSAANWTLSCTILLVTLLLLYPVPDFVSKTYFSKSLAGTTYIISSLFLTGVSLFSFFTFLRMLRHGFEELSSTVVNLQTTLESDTTTNQ